MATLFSSRWLLVCVAAVMLRPVPSRAAEDFPVGSIQRHRFVAASEDGRRVAMLLTHFGPSSHAPFAVLLVKEVGKAEPVWQDNRFLIEGGEEQLKSLGEHLLKESQAKLAELGLKTAHVHEATAVWSPGKDRIASGHVDVRRELTVLPFSVQEEDVATCKDGLKGKRWKVCVGDACLPVASGDDCYTRGVALRNLYRTKDAHWFVVHRKIPVFAALNAFVVDFVGVATPGKR